MQSPAFGGRLGNFKLLLASSPTYAVVSFVNKPSGTAHLPTSLLCSDDPLRAPQVLDVASEAKFASKGSKY